MPRLQTALMLSSLAACGPSVLESGSGGGAGGEDLRNAIAGYYSSRVGGVQVEPRSTTIQIFHFDDDGSGELYWLSCEGVRIDKGAFMWEVDEEGEEVSLVFGEEYDHRVGHWGLPAAPCTTPWVIDVEPGRSAEVSPGRRCNPELGPRNPDGRHTCDFEVCDGISQLCEG